jgi:ATP-dependent RNA helicase MSS116
VHRIGRTARAGESGEGQLIIDPSETKFITHLQRETKIDQAPLNIPEQNLASWTKLVNHALDTNPDILEKKGHAYQAWLGFNKDKSKLTGAKVDQVIAAANTYALETLRYKPAPGEVLNKPNSHLPPLQAKTIGKMGLKAQRGMFHVGEYEAPAPRNGMGRGKRQ